jgi:hypothetical protein
MPAPYKSTLPLSGRWERCARAERRPRPACRLHWRVRRLGRGVRTRGRGPVGLTWQCLPRTIRRHRSNPDLERRPDYPEEPEGSGAPPWPGAAVLVARAVAGAGCAMPALRNQRLRSNPDLVRRRSFSVWHARGFARGCWVKPPNEMLISCKRLVRTYGPLLPLGGADSGGAPRRPRLSAALAG